MTRPSRPFVALLLLATILLLYVAYPFRTPLFLAVVIAAVLHDPLERLTIALRGRRTIASALITLAVFVLIVAPFAALVGFVTRESAAGLAYLRETLGVSSVSELRGVELPAVLQRTLEVLHLDSEQVFDADNVQLLSASLPEDERAVFRYDPSSIDWWEYWINIHIPALRRWVYPLIEGRAPESRSRRVISPQPAWNGPERRKAAPQAGAAPGAGTQA